MSGPPRRSSPGAGPLVAGLCAGTVTGLFWGEAARVIQPVADGFVRLLQMAVLPYLTVSLVASIGTLQPAHLRRLGARVAIVMVGLWSLALGCAFLIATSPVSAPRHRKKH